MSDSERDPDVQLQVAEAGDSEIKPSGGSQIQHSCYRAKKNTLSHHDHVKVSLLQLTQTAYKVVKQCAYTRAVLVNKEHLVLPC